MKVYRLALLVLILMPLAANAQYWFQYGAKGGPGSAFNNGAKVTIETVYNPGISSGSLGFWVGEDLSNGDFIQDGYLVSNETGYYPTGCTISGCQSAQLISKGSAEWFYEYFYPSGTGGFLGSIGTNDSAGPAGSFNTYGFYSEGGEWYFFMGNRTIGSVYLGSNSSGSNAPVGFAELANASNPNSDSPPVIFSNLSVYQGGKFLPITYGYSYIGYGLGSLTRIPNPYGVQEIGSRVNYYEVGSGLQQPPNGQQLWQLGYYLDIASDYGNISGSNEYLAYKNIKISAPQTVYLNNTSRAVFSEWEGNGVSAYNGTESSANVTLYSNITEVALWNLQYLFNVSSMYGSVGGYGWHDANSMVGYSVNSSEIYTNSTARWQFANWSNGETSTNSSVLLSGPYSVSAQWQRQYAVNVTSILGGMSGSGWYDANSTAEVGVANLYGNVVNSSRIGFYSWSNGNSSTTTRVKVSAPVNIYAVFVKQFLVHFTGEDQYGTELPAAQFYISNASVGNGTFLFQGQPYNVAYAYYKGVRIGLNRSVSVNSPSNLTMSLPVYDMEVKTADVFGIPVNVPITLLFLNGTAAYAYSGPDGILSFPDVPYGSASMSARYLGETITAQASSGNVVKITFISLLDMLVFAAIGAIGFAVYFYSSRKLSASTPRSRS